MKKILLIEDNIELSSQIMAYFAGKAYQIDLSVDIKSALDLVDNQYDLALLDINLPDGSGLELLRTLKEKNIRTIIMTVKDEDDFIVHALDSGADDYITKPFSLAVLRARIDLALRDSVIESQGNLKYKDFILDESNIKIYYKNRQIDLTSREYEILKTFLKSPNRIFTRDFLLDYFWDQRENLVNDNTLTVTIKRIREKTFKDAIETIRGIGYRMC